jgi:predicted transcriptional regulator
MTEIKKGTLDEFFASAKETAKEIDARKKITPKKAIWVETDDFLKLLKPSRIELIRFLRGEQKVYYSTLLESLHKSPSSLSQDLELLSRYGLIEIDMEVNPGHGRKKVIRPLFEDEVFELKAAV